MDFYESSKSKTKRYGKLKKLLQMVFGYSGFRPKQYEIINRIVNGEDVCAILSTGYGKSICFQIPALYLDKPAIIISPLISLMNDQQMILKKLGIASCCYNSTIANKFLMRSDMLQGKYRLIYVSPETIVKIKDFLVELESAQGLSLIAIDEAHCISSYGFDFRKSYRDLAFLKELLPQVPILAITATATREVADDICKVLNLKTETPIKTSFNRVNLYLEVNPKSRVTDDIIPIIKKYPDKPIIIYCLTKKETEKVAVILKEMGVKCGIYHSGIETQEKMETHHDFLSGEINIVVATIAFGMGINKPDVRVVIHYGAPKSIEGYYQEIGRAGRDGKKAYCYAFYSGRDFCIQRHFIEESEDPLYRKNQKRLLEHIKSYLESSRCRKQLILEYFDEELEERCQFCDNCCGKKLVTTKTNYIEQNVKKEAKLLIDLIESMGNRSFGAHMYINILRGSSNKSINSVIKKSRFYGSGKHRSFAWWKELVEQLIKLNFLQQVHLKGKFLMQVLKTTRQGAIWANQSQLNELLGNVTADPLPLIKMSKET